MNSEIFWLAFWPIFIYICYFLIKLFVKKIEKTESKEIS
jgi:hypothetical protein